MLGATYGATMKTAQQAGVNTEGNAWQTLKSSAKVSTENIKGNIAYLKDGVVTQEATIARRGMQTSFQGDGKPVEAYRINIDKTLTVEQNLANTPGLSYEMSTGQYYVQTSWGAKSYVNPDAAKGYMYVKYGEYVDDAGKLVIDKNAEKVFILVTTNSGRFIEKRSYWDFSSIKNVITFLN